MSGYDLSPAAIDDLTDIVANRMDHRGLDSALDLRDRILSACGRLVITPGMGHRRSDLIVYTRYVEPLPILRILHSHRNIKKLLKVRP
jgi:plasmid stabilization system protein ParE